MHRPRHAITVPLCAWLALTASSASGQQPATEGGAPAAESAKAAPASPPSQPPPAEALSTEGGPLTLEQAVQLAAKRNEVALAAEQQSEAARARLARARAFFFPELTGTGTYTRRLYEVTREVGGQTVVIQRNNALNANFVASMPLFDARGIFLYRAARRDGDAAGLEAVEARRQIGFEAANAFLSTLAQEQVYRAAEQRLAFARQSLQDASARAKAGLASSNDVTRAELEAASAEVQMSNARNAAQTTRLELGFLLVSSVKGTLASPDALLSDASRPLQAHASLADGALDRRPDILAARLRVDALEESAKEPLARLLPTLGASATYRLTNEAGFNGRTGDGFLGVNLIWNFFDGGERYAERRERVALAKAAELQVQATTRRVDVDIEQARVALENAQAALAQSDLAVRTARQNAEEQGILYRQGLSTALTVADASLRQFEAEVAYAQSRFALGVALLGLRAAVGLDPLGKEP
ncbi:MULTISPECIES: TolC family protein [Myxococcus]|uniref:TolC family protein n=1 Tax=Myxococcus TaxID=32 RepID=UPI001143F5E6|nr:MULTISPECIES: TolC family protein [Myxococcus]NOK02742.1 TolC family protein [Myxococcus xanthus]